MMKLSSLLIGATLVLSGSAAWAEAPAEPPLPGALAVGQGGRLQVGLLLQGWFFLDRANDATESTFRLRRAEIHLKGEIIRQRVAYAVMIDPAKVLELSDKTVTTAAGDTAVIKQPASAVSVMQDFFITFLTAYADISLGQFKIPVSWEGYNSSSRLLFPERALVSSTYGDKRDLGLRVAKSSKYLGYSAGLFNGTGLNLRDNNNAKDIALRLEAYPVPGLMVGGVVMASIKESGTPNTKTRYEGDLRLERGPLLLQGELIQGTDVDGKGAEITGRGFYAAAAVRVKSFQAAFRLGYLDPDVSQDLDPAADEKDEVWTYEAGLNYYLRSHEAKLQASYSRLQYQTDKPHNQLIVAAQVAF